MLPTPFFSDDTSRNVKKVKPGWDPGRENTQKLCHILSIFYTWIKPMSIQNAFPGRLVHVNHVTLKQTLRSLLLSHQRVGWHTPSQAFFWYDTDYKSALFSLRRLYSIVDIKPKEGFAGLVPSFSMTMTKIL